MKQFPEYSFPQKRSNPIQALHYSISIYFLLLFLTFSAVQAQTTSLGCKASDECFDVTYTSFTRNSNHTVTLSFSVKTNCGNALSHVAFELPAGAKATNARNTNTRFTYSYENGTNNPFYSLKFEATSAEGFKNGAVDHFSYTLTAAEFAKLSTIRVEAKASGSVGTVSFRAQTCEPAKLVIAGPAMVEANTRVTYSVPANQLNAPYIWTAPEGWVIVSGQGTNTVTCICTAKTGEMQVRQGTYSFGSLAVAGYELSDGALPVTLTSFTATTKANVVNLAWATASERDNKEFILERSYDAVNFEPVQTVSGNGTTNTVQNYLTTDAAPAKGTVYYRLKQVDLDGAYEYSKAISVALKPATVAPVLAVESVYPNPFQGELTVHFTSGTETATTLTLFDLTGKVAANQSAAAGTNSFRFTETGNLKPGIYILKVSQGQQSMTLRVVKN